MSETAKDPTRAAATPSDVRTRRDRLRWASVRVAYARAIEKFGANKATDVAASLTYYLVLALFPGLLAIVSLLSLVNADGSVSEGLIDMLHDYAPKSTVDALDGPITAIMSAPGAGFGLVIGLLGAVWSASKYVKGFSHAANRVYGVEEGRTTVSLRIMVFTVTLVGLVMITLMAMLLILSGPVARAIGSAVGLGDVALDTWNWAKWPVMVILAALVIAILYYYAPNVKPTRFRWLSIGAFTAMVVWAVTTVGFVAYVTNSGGYNATYGSLGGVIIFLVWLYLSNLALVFGAQVDAELERARQLQAGIPAEYAQQLELRGTTMIDKAVEKEARSVIAARELRQSMSRRRR